jgi:phosphoglycerate dehydrogenase-like enzyme
VRTPPESGPVVVGVLYPREWFGDPDAFSAAVAAVAAVDPRIEVLVEPYEEGQHLRTLRGHPEHLAEARNLVPDLTDAQRALFARVQAVVAIDLPFDVGRVAPQLAWVQSVGAGTAQLESAGLREARIHLTNASGTNAIAIAEFVVGRVLQEQKHFRALDARQREHRWEPLYGNELAGTTIGLVGLGAINAAVARRLQAFDVHVLAARRTAKPGDTAPDVDELYPTARLHDMFARCDTVIAAVPETADTIGLMDGAAFAAMPRGSFFVNVGRGTLVDEPALIDALERGRLRGAALDVASLEPLPAEHPLWDAPNLYLSYHCSSAPSALFVNLHRLWTENVRRWLAGEELLNEVVSP